MIIQLRRLLAIAIDYYIIFHIIYLPLNYIFKNSTNILVDILSGLLAIILLVNLFLRKDCLIGYESVGKKIMRLKIFQNGKTVQNKKILVDRIFYTLWPFMTYPFMVLYNNKSKGDIRCNTEVKSFRKNN